MEASIFYLLMLENYINSKQKNSEIKDYSLCLDNVWKCFTIYNVKKTGLKGVVTFFQLIVILLIIAIF